MSGSLSHAPSQIVRQLLIDLGLGADGGSTWPVYAEQEPDSPDACITVYETAGVGRGRFQQSGGVQVLYGIQVRVRAANAQKARTKADDVLYSLTQEVYQDVVAVTDDEGYGTGSSSYTFCNISYRSGPLPVLDPNSNRGVYTLNMLANLKEN